MKIEGKEIRNISFRLKADEEKRTIEGYAALFETASDGLWFGREIIERGAFDGVLEVSDVFALLNHDMNRGVLARWKKKEVSLMLSVDETGLRYSFEAPKTALGDELLENVRRGEVDESSFAFEIESDTWTSIGDDKWERRIHKFKQIYDVSPVYAAAYSTTSVYIRSKEVTNAIIKEQRAKIEEESRKAGLPAYFDGIQKRFNIN